MVSGMTHHRQLSIRQAQVLSLLVRGMTNKEIARALHIAEGTTNPHGCAAARVGRSQPHGSRRHSRELHRADEIAAKPQCCGPGYEIARPADAKDVELLGSFWPLLREHPLSELVDRPRGFDLKAR